MRVLVIAALVLGACKATPTEDDRLNADVRTFCSAYERYGHPTTMSPIAARLVSELHDPRFLDLLSRVPPDVPDAWLAEVSKAVQHAGVTSCPTLDWAKSDRFARPR